MNKKSIKEEIKKNKMLKYNFTDLGIVIEAKSLEEATKKANNLINGKNGNN